MLCCWREGGKGGSFCSTQALGRFYVLQTLYYGARTQDVKQVHGSVLSVLFPTIYKESVRRIDLVLEALTKVIKISNVRRVQKPRVSTENLPILHWASLYRCTPWHDMIRDSCQLG